MPKLTTLYIVIGCLSAIILVLLIILILQQIQQNDTVNTVVLSDDTSADITMSSLPAFLISLPRDIETRGEEVYSALKKVGHNNISIVLGIDGFDDANDELMRELGLAEKGTRSTYPFALRPGERGCAASHLSLIHRIVRQNMYNGAFIFEDDAVPCDQYLDIIDKDLNFEDFASFDVVLLGSGLLDVTLFNNNTKILPYAADAAHAYYLSYHGAQQIISKIQAEPIDRPIDSWMRTPSLSGLNMGVVNHNAFGPISFPSDVVTEMSLGLMGQGVKYGSAIGGNGKKGIEGTRI